MVTVRFGSTAKTFSTCKEATCPRSQRRTSFNASGKQCKGPGSKGATLSLADQDFKGWYLKRSVTPTRLSAAPDVPSNAATLARKRLVRYMITAHYHILSVRSQLPCLRK
jgi:hypothetical protein